MLVNLKLFQTKTHLKFYIDFKHLKRFDQLTNFLLYSFFLIKNGKKTGQTHFNFV